jgi:hypothetical protein
LTYTSEASPRTLSAALGLASIAALIGLGALIGFTAPAHAADSGGIGMGGTGDDPPSTATRAPGVKARLKHGYAIPPAGAPRKVVRAIEAANRIVKGRPYCLGGGHARWESRCYDCSGSISYALGEKGARVLDAPMPSGSFMRWQKPGRGRWITIYANGGHMYAVIAGLRLDTSMTAGDGPGWSKTRRQQSGFSVRHPRGL